MSEAKNVVEAYLKDKKVLILDDSSACRTTIRNEIIALGASDENIFSTRNFKKAEHIIETSNIEVIFTDFNIDKYYGLDLLNTHQRAVLDPTKRLFVLVTANADESNVAEAAEEDVDAYILKPFSKVNLKKYIEKAVLFKAQPSKYIIKISEGKIYLSQGVADQAGLKFEEAKHLNNRPTLACYYNGKVKLSKDLVDEALTEFDTGLSYNDIHYKCLTGRFDILESRNQRQLAYEVIKKLVQHFPISPKRLGKIFKLAVYTDNFADVEDYYQLYITLERRSRELTNIVAAGMMVAGKFHLSKGRKNQAHDCFISCVKTSGMDVNYIQKTFEACIDARMLNEAKQIVHMFPQALRAGALYRFLEFTLLSETNFNQHVLEYGFDLAKEGTPYAKVYEKLMRQFMKLGQKNKAETVYYWALEKFPEMREKFDQIMS